MSSILSVQSIGRSVRPMVVLVVNVVDCCNLCKSRVMCGTHMQA